MMISTNHGDESTKWQATVSVSGLHIQRGQSSLAMPATQLRLSMTLDQGRELHAIMGQALEDYDREQERGHEVEADHWEDARPS